MRNRLTFSSEHVNSENPVSDLSKAQIKQIYDNNAEKWSDIK